jgi:3-methylcrotonyl-CoA carboxylase alpha subunit
MGPQMKVRRAGDSGEIEVEIDACEGAKVSARINGEAIIAELEHLADGSAMLRVNGRRIRITGARTRNSIVVTAGPASFEFTPIEGRVGNARHGLAAPEVTAPMPGKILKVLVAEGDRVEHGQALAVLEAMKMETTLYAESAAIVKKISVAEGEMVDHGAVIITFNPAAEDPLTSESKVPGE